MQKCKTCHRHEVFWGTYTICYNCSESLCQGCVEECKICNEKWKGSSLRNDFCSDCGQSCEKCDEFICLAHECRCDRHNEYLDKIIAEYKKRRNSFGV